MGIAIIQQAEPSSNLQCHMGIQKHQHRPSDSLFHLKFARNDFSAFQSQSYIVSEKHNNQLQKQSNKIILHLIYKKRNCLKPKCKCAENCRSWFRLCTQNALAASNLKWTNRKVRMERAKQYQISLFKQFCENWLLNFEKN